MQITPELEKLLQIVADELIDSGAKAVVLRGSWVRGDALPESDVDLVVIGEGQPYLLARRGAYLVSYDFVSAERWREMFHDPREVGGVIPGWRNARILRDPERIAAALQAKAIAWTWDSLERACDAWVAEKFTGWSEEVHKLVNAFAAGRMSAAAVQRNLLATHLAPILAVHLRILYESENYLWDIISEPMGGEWGAAQSQAFGVNGEDFEATCRAALRLFVLAAREVDGLLDDRQRGVVQYAVGLADRVGK